MKKEKFLVKDGVVVGMNPWSLIQCIDEKTGFVMLDINDFKSLCSKLGFPK